MFAETDDYAFHDLSLCIALPSRCAANAAIISNWHLRQTLLPSLSVKLYDLFPDQLADKVADRDENTTLGAIGDPSLSDNISECA